MADLSRRPGNRPSRREREQRAYALTLATGGFGLVAVVGVLLAIVGIIGIGLPLLSGLVAIVCGLLLRRTVSP